MNARIAMLVASLFASTGCATLMAPRTASMEVSSNIPGAEIRVNGQPQGNTPATVNFDRESEPKIEVAYPGYKSRSCHVGMQAKMTYIAADAALCVFLFPLGCVSFIDAGGAWNEPSSKSCSVTLEPDYGNPYAAAAYQQPQASAWNGHPAQPSSNSRPAPQSMQQQPLQPAAQPGYQQPPPGYQLVPVSRPPQPPPGYQPPPGLPARSGSLAAR